MDAGGVLASMNFPSFPTFTARVFASEDPDLSLALVRAYNDWHIDEWCGAHPGRFIPMAVPVIWDPSETADEIRRTAAKGCHSLSFTENPAALGYPSFHDEYWDPVWKACCDTGTVLSIHLGSSGRLSIPAVDSPPDVMITLQPMNIQSAAADLLWSRVLKNFPDLRVALSEGGTGWIPYFLDRVDRTFEMHHAWTLQDFGGRLPSEVFREHFLTCFISDPVGRRAAATGSASTTWPGRRTTRTATPCGRPPPRSCTPCSPSFDVPDDEIAQDDPRERHALVLVRPLRPRPQGGGDGGGAPPARGRATTCRSCPAAPGCAPRTRSSRGSAGGPAGGGRRALTRAADDGGPADDRAGRRSVAWSTDRSAELVAAGPQPVPERGAGIEDVRFGHGPGRRRVAPADGIQQCGVLGTAPALLFREQLEVAGRHHPYRLAEVGEQPRRARRQVDGPVEPPVGPHDVGGVVDGVEPARAARPAAAR